MEIKKRKTAGAKILVLGIAGAALIAASAIFARGASKVIPANKHCVAYTTDKTMFFMANVSVVGMNCDISSQLDSAGLTINVPIKSFDSDSSGRDDHVAEILRVKQSPDLVFEVPGMTAGKIRQGLKNGSMEIQGTLKVGNKKYPVTSTAVFVDGKSASGVIKTSYSHFDIETPNVGPGGMIADLKDEIYLHYNIVLSRISGY